MEEQLDLLSYRPKIPNIHFKGDTYDVAFDCERLNRRQRQVYECMIDGVWRTLREISDLTGVPEASVSARIRDFRNHEYLSQFFFSEGRRRGNPKLGIWEYALWRKEPGS